MGIYRHPNSPYWYYTFTVDGEGISGSTRTANKALAREIYEARKIDCLRGNCGIRKKERFPFASLVSDFLEWSKASKRSHARDVILAKDLRDAQMLLKWRRNRRIQSLK